LCANEKHFQEFVGGNAEQKMNGQKAAVVVKAADKGGMALEQSW